MSDLDRLEEWSLIASSDEVKTDLEVTHSCGYVACDAESGDSLLVLARTVLADEHVCLPESSCRHCGRRIVESARDRWIDPEASGDDSVWRETCDMHDTFTAEHEPGEE